MPAILANAKNFLINSDYPMDKVILLRSGSFSAPTSTGTETVAHGLPFTPLIGGYWSLTPDFSVTYEFGNGTFPSNNSGYLFTCEIGSTYASTTSVVMNWSNNGSATTIYYRIFGFEPENSNADIDPISSEGDDFIINSDYNYLKLYDAGIAASGTATSHTVVHSLGYIPQAVGWYEYAFLPGLIWPITTESNVALEVNTSNITFLNPFGNDVAAVHWRIYLDE